MSETSYELRFSGEIVEGADLAEVKTRMATMFKVDATRVERLFSGRTVILKRGLDPETAIKYRAALHRAGAVVALLASAETSGAEDRAASASASASNRSSSDADFSLAEPGVLLVEPRPRVSANIDIDALSMASPGVDLVEPGTVIEPDIDIEDLTLAPTGVDLIEPSAREQPQIDTSALSVAPVGERLTEPQPKPKVDIDTNGLQTI